MALYSQYGSGILLQSHMNETIHPKIRSSVRFTQSCVVSNLCAVVLFCVTQNSIQKNLHAAPFLSSTNSSVHFGADVVSMNGCCMQKHCVLQNSPLCPTERNNSIWVWNHTLQTVSTPCVVILCASLCQFVMLGLDILSLQSPDFFSSLYAASAFIL